MTDIRCPMCGKPNPDDAEVCQHCQARLKPLVGPSTPGEESEERQLESPHEETPSQEGVDSDWLDSLRPAGEEIEGDLDSEEGQADWLEGDQETSLPEPASDQEEDDWLADLRQEGQVESDASEEGEGQEQESDWVSPFDEEGTENLPEWLSGSADEEAEGEKSQEEPPAFEGADIDEPEEGQEPEWLRRIRARQHEEETGEAAEQESEPEEQLSQWISDERQDEFPAEPSLPDEEGLPDWVSEESETSEVEPSPIEEGEEELPEWLDQEEQQPTPESEEESLDWLPEFEEEVVESETPEGPPEGEIPDWLGEIEEEAPPAWPSDQPEDEGELEDQPQESAGLEEAEELPEWVRALEASKPVLDEPQPASEPSDEEGVISFDWLEEEFEEETQEEIEIEELFDEEAEPFEEAPPEPVQPFLADEDQPGEESLPEWLSEAAPQDKIVEDEELSEEDEEEGEIERAELPGWLEAMRPVEAVAPESPVADERDEVVETSGPLAGLQGVIPAEPEVARRKKPASYSIKLQVSQNQQAHAGVLQNLIETEIEPKPIPSGPAISSQLFLRLGIFILLVVVIFWPVLTGSQTAPLPAFSGGAFDANRAIDQLAGAPVLFAVDYNPALSGEMEAATGAVLDHLMVKGAYLALVSTTPTGPAQAERLVKTINAQGEHFYQGVNEYANLGYIPGGQTGLFSFAQTPHRVLPFDLDGNQVWQSTPLQNVQALSNFGLVVVATENPDTARAWIEQVQPQLGQVPLIMVVSAQAEPIVRPYYQGTPQQVQGFVTGLSGGASYEGLMNRGLLARKYWDSFSLGILAAAGLILVGSGVSLFSALLTGGGAKGGGGKS